AQVQIELLRRDVAGSHFQSNNSNITPAESRSNSFHQAACQASPTMLWCDPDRRDVAGVIGLEQSDHESRHRAVLHDHSVSHGFGSRQKVIKRIATVSLAIDEASLIQAPAFVDLRHC